MSVTVGVLLQFEQVAELLAAEVPLHIFFLVHHTTAQGFLVSLALEDLLFYCSCLNTKKKKTEDKGVGWDLAQENNKQPSWSIVLECTVREMQFKVLVNLFLVQSK